MVIAIDGPAGAGKSTVARAIAQHLGFAYLDTGAMYRCVALAASQSGRDPEQVARDARISLSGRVLLDGRDVTEAIRTPEVSQEASKISTDPAVRAALVAQQQSLLRDGDWVAEGRDIGTVVAPHAAVKVFLTAAPEERARRRAQELHADESTVLYEQTRRDQQDAKRAASPLVQAPDAVALDTTELTLDQVIEQILTLAARAEVTR
ncbi:MAG: (d)CMP kinase [Solirubrobacterales bacterium]|nr:(d)CMP kinase [Solirubrobacterales bacterium]